MAAAMVGKTMPSASSAFAAYASVSAMVMLCRSVFYELVPAPLQRRLSSMVHSWINRRPTSLLTLTIDEKNGMSKNDLYDAAHAYLSTKISPSNSRLRISKSPKEPYLTVRFDDGERITDSYDGITLNWSLISSQSPGNYGDGGECGGGGGGSNTILRRCFQLSFEKQHREVILGSYLPYVMSRSKALKEEKKSVKLFTLGPSYGPGAQWESINLDHPATFDKLAMDPHQKKALIDDLDRFVRRKEFYKRVGRAWKRGYLLYGPPGTGKSSLVAALANYLKFDIYDLQLANIMRDSDLRRLLLATSNSSILVIEDIDCSVELPGRHPKGAAYEPRNVQLTLSGLLNFVDGLWSSCGDERIIVFTTNHKEKLDPALLRPGRMDRHVHMSYCTIDGFRLLASTYLGVSPADGSHRELFGEIEELMGNVDVQVTPAQIAEELMKSEDADVALGEVVKLLKRKRVADEEEAAAAAEAETKKAKKRKVGGGMDRKKAVRNYLLERAMGAKKAKASLANLNHS